MRRIFLAVMAVAAFGGAASLPATQVRSAVAAKDWTQLVVATPDGGFRIGNPNAPVKLVEYGSLTCPHCAAFAEEGMPQLLSQYVKGGRISFEFRNYVRDPFDMTGALLSRCATPANFFPLIHRYFETQDVWYDRLKNDVGAIERLPEPQRFARIADVGGLDAIAGTAGLSYARVDQCLTDPQGLAKLVRMRKVANDVHKVLGTPTFILNGKTTKAYDWAALRPLLGPPAG